MSTQADERAPTPEEAAGMAWWNNLSEAARDFWLARSENGSVAGAYAAFKLHDLDRTDEARSLAGPPASK